MRTLRLSPRSLVRALSVLLVLTVMALVAACGSDDPTPVTPTPTPKQEISYTLFSWTKELTPETLAAATVSTDDGTITFSGSPAQLKGLKRGDILVSGAHTRAPSGLLRQVLSVEATATGIVVDTQPAAMQLAFEKLHAKIDAVPFTMDGKPAPGASGSVSQKAVYSKGESYGGGQKLDQCFFDQDNNRDTKTDQLYLTGQVEGKVFYNITIDLDWLENAKKAASELSCALAPACDASFPDVKIVATAGVTAGLSIDLDGAAAKNFDTDEFAIEGTQYDLPKIAIGPVVIFPSLDFVAQVSGKASSRFHAKAGVSFNVSTQVSAGLTSGIKFVPPDPKVEFTPPTVEVFETAELKASIGPRLSLMLWATFGPTFSVRGFGKVRANAEATPCWAFDIGGELQAGISLKIPWKVFGLQKLGSLLGLSGEIAGKRFGPWPIFEKPNVLTGNCGKLPDDVYPPGDGPKTPAYLDPKFAPWSRLYEIEAMTYPFSVGAAAAQIYTEKAIDNSWLISGIGIPGVLKLSETGNLVWSKELTLPRATEELDTLPEDVRSTLAVQALNTNIWVASSRLSVLQLNQDGIPTMAMRYVPTEDARREQPRQLEPVAVLPQVDGGAWIVFSPKETIFGGGGLVLHVDAKGKLLLAKRFQYPEGETTYLTGAVQLDGGDLVISGFSFESGSEVAHIARMRPDGTFAFAKKLSLCGSDRVRPGPSIKLASGAIAIATTYSLAPEQSALVQIAPDGSQVSSFAWWSGSSVHDAVNNSIAQLPVSGFLSLGADIGVGDDMHIVLSSQDAQGAFNWQQTLRLAKNGNPWQFTPGSLKLTNDGGALVVSHAVASDQTSEGLWISKLPARTGDGNFDPSHVTRGNNDFVLLNCTPQLTDETQALGDIALTTVDVKASIGVKNMAHSDTKLIP